MSRIGIVYYSGGGTTTEFANAVVQGVEASGNEVLLHKIEGREIVEGRWSGDECLAQLDECDAIIFGTPTYMGGVSAQLKAFFDATVPRWYQQSWNGKYAAAFTVSAKTSGDKLNSLQDIFTFAMQMGMLWVGTGGGVQEVNGYYIGAGITAMNPDAVTEAELATARALGERVVGQL
ncbi:MAG: flavodoxin family protein [Pseudomonadales bacterium]|nr:flavodoxin family protein [Pseudomonadales bacterium]